MLQTTYGKNGTTFEIGVPADFQAELDALSPRMAYCAEYGIKQSVADAYSPKELSPAEIIGRGQKKWAAILLGTVRVAGTGERQPSKTPIEREIWRLAAAEMVPVFAKNAKRGNAVPKERQAYYIGSYIDRERERLTELAMAAVPIAANAEDDLDALFANVALMEDETEEEAA